MVNKSGLNFPILSDPDRKVAREYGLLHAGGAPDGSDIAIPAHILVDRNGKILWQRVAKRIQDRPSPGEVLAAIESSGLTADE